MRKHLKKSNNHEKIQEFLKKYNVPKEFTSTSRKMMSRGSALGIFIAMIPMPLQMVAVLFFIPLFRFNVPIALIMCWVTNPFTMPFIYYVEYITGSFFLGIKTTEVTISLEWFQNNIENILLPLYLGAFIYSIVLSVLIYYLITHLWIKSVQSERNDSKNSDQSIQSKINKEC